MKGMNNNILAVMLTAAIFVSLMTTSNVMMRLSELAPPATGHAAQAVANGQVGICVSARPDVDSIDPQGISQGGEFYYNVTASYTGTGDLTFDSNSTIFTINITTGIINFTATNDDVGQYWTRIFAVESVCNLTGEEVVNITVYNTNDAPQLLPDPIPDQTMYEDEMELFDQNDLQKKELLIYLLYPKFITHCKTNAKALRELMDIKLNPEGKISEAVNKYEAIKPPEKAEMFKYMFEEMPWHIRKQMEL